jgi:hypothetical protein
MFRHGLRDLCFRPGNRQVCSRNVRCREQPAYGLSLSSNRIIGQAARNCAMATPPQYFIRSSVRRRVMHVSQWEVDSTGERPDIRD